MPHHGFKSGSDRRQPSLLPARVEDYVGADNPVRAIDAYIDALDLVALGFVRADRETGAGQPPYAPSDLLKLYVYGYLNQVRSTRRLEREATRNLELIWLLRGLRPGYRTIGDFRARNWAALKAANRGFVLLARGLDLVGGELVAIDGAFFHGDASPASITTRKHLVEQLVKLDADIEAYGETLDANDADEATVPTEAIPARLADLMAKRAQAAADLAQVEASGETQLSRTDADARLLFKRGQRIAGYNVQVAIDDKHKLIVASDVVNDGNDTGQLHTMARAAQQAVGAETLTALADSGYYNGDSLMACEADGIIAYVPPARRTGRLAAQGRITHTEFRYDAAEDVYRCPAGALLRPMQVYKEDVGGKRHIRYVSRKPACDACPLNARCLTDKAYRRTIYRWEHRR